MGPDGKNDFAAYRPDVAHDPVLGRYLVVWYGDDDSLVDGELEIWGQLVDGPSGALIGTNFRISEAGPEGDPGYRAWKPAVTFHPPSGRFLVAWEAYTGSPGNLDQEIFCQWIDSASGDQVGPNDFQVSDMGGPGDPDFEATEPDLVYCPQEDEILVVWHGSDDRVGLAQLEREIFGQRLDAKGNQVGANDFRISHMGTDGDPEFDAYHPSVAWSDLSQHYLVVWYGDDTVPGDDELEIWGQLLEVTGAEAGPDDFRISDLGPEGNDWYRAFVPSVAFLRGSNEFAVTWDGIDDVPAGGIQREAWCQIVDAESGSERGANDFRLSDMGKETSVEFGALRTAVAADASGQFLSIWNGDDEVGLLVNDEFEIFGQLVTSSVADRYCTAGTSASGCRARIEATGTPSAPVAKGFFLTATDVEGGKSGLFFFGANGRQANPWGQGTSYQCVVPPVKRAGLLAASGTTGQCDGWFTQDLNARWAARPPQNPGAGATVQAQLWYRDPLNTSKQTTSLSDAVEFVVTP
jgi:hypothetical protein